jgi:anhydro-N-acetylmuramic acid kinase
MSGTSGDGVDAALVRLHDPLRAELVAFVTEPYEEAERVAMRDAVARGSASDLALLHAALGERLAAAALAVMAAARVAPGDLAFVASHGHTVWHEPGRVSWQLGDPAIIAERVGVKVISDFRARDVAAGGHGAPLVARADVMLFGREDGPRVLLNVGGMANITYVSRRGEADGVIGFDTGPGVAVIDAVTRRVDPGTRFDEGGRRAARGTPNTAALESLLADPYFDAPPPKSTGRERFGDAYAERVVALVRDDGGTDDDAIATATELTVRTIAAALDRFVPNAAWDLVISGGGAENMTLVSGLGALIPRLSRFDDLFFDGGAKEAVAFAVLGWLTLAGRPGNVPAVTGARGTRVLGSVTPR